MYKANLINQIILFTLYTLLIVRNMDIYNPKCWFTLTYFLYSISYPLLYYLNLLDSSYGCSSSLLPIEFIGLLSFLGGMKIPYFKIKSTHDKFSRNKITNLDLIEIILIIGNILIFICSLLLILGGYHNKRELYSSANFFVLIIMKYVYLHLILVVYYYISKNKLKKITIISMFAIISLSLISGERDISFTVLLMLIMLLYKKNIIKKRHILILTPLIIILIPLSSVFKYFFMSNMKGDFAIFTNINTLLHDFFYSEFIAGSRNFQIVLNNPQLFDFEWYSVIPSIVSRLFNINYISPMGVLNNVIFARSMTGYGFTIIGEGYAYNGIIGIISIMLFLGYFSKVLYIKSENNPVNKTVYLYMIPLFIYTGRAEISSIIMPFLKYLFIFYLIVKFTRNCKIKGAS